MATQTQAERQNAYFAHQLALAQWAKDNPDEAEKDDFTYAPKWGGDVPDMSTFKTGGWTVSGDAGQYGAKDADISPYLLDSAADKAWQGKYSEWVDGGGKGLPPERPVTNPLHPSYAATDTAKQGAAVNTAINSGLGSSYDLTGTSVPATAVIAPPPAPTVQPTQAATGGGSALTLLGGGQGQYDSGFVGPVAVGGPAPGAGATPVAFGQGLSLSEAGGSVIGAAPVGASPWSGGSIVDTLIGQLGGGPVDTSFLNSIIGAPSVSAYGDVEIPKKLPDAGGGSDDPIVMNPFVVSGGALGGGGTVIGGGGSLGDGGGSPGGVAKDATGGSTVDQPKNLQPWTGDDDFSKIANELLKNRNEARAKNGLPPIRVYDTDLVAGVVDDALKQVDSLTEYLKADMAKQQQANPNQPWSPPAVIPLPVDPVTGLVITVVLNRGNLANVLGGSSSSPQNVVDSISSAISNPVATITDTGTTLIGGAGLLDPNKIMGPTAPPGGPLPGDGATNVTLGDGLIIGAGGGNSTNQSGSNVVAPTSSLGGRPSTSLPGDFGPNVITPGVVGSTVTPPPETTGAPIIFPTITGPVPTVTGPPENTGVPVIFPTVTGPVPTVTGPSVTPPPETSGPPAVITPPVAPPVTTNPEVTGPPAVVTPPVVQPPVVTPPPTTGGGGTITPVITPVPTPTPVTVATPSINRNLLAEGNTSNNAYNQLAGSTMGNYGQFSGMPGQADIQNFMQLFPQLMAYNQGLTGIASGQTQQANSSLRSGNLQDVNAMAGAASGINRSANQELYGMLGQQGRAAGTMLGNDLSDLLRGGALSGEDLRGAQQGAREAYAARGRVGDNSAMAAEVLNRDALSRQREQERRANYQQSYANFQQPISGYSANRFDPFSTLLGNGMQTQNTGTNQNLFGQGTSFSSGNQSNQFVQSQINPWSTYASDVYGSNFNAENARNISQANANAALQGANLSMIGQGSSALLGFLGKLWGGS